MFNRGLEQTIIIIIMQQPSFTASTDDPIAPRRVYSN